MSCLKLDRDSCDERFLPVLVPVVVVVVVAPLVLRWTTRFPEIMLPRCIMTSERHGRRARARYRSRGGGEERASGESTVSSWQSNGRCWCCRRPGCFNMVSIRANTNMGNTGRAASQREGDQEESWVAPTTVFRVLYSRCYLLRYVVLSCRVSYGQRESASSHWLDDDRSELQ